MSFGMDADTPNHSELVRSYVDHWPRTADRSKRDDFLTASWHRCMKEYGLQPDLPRATHSVARGALTDALEANHRLLRIARVEMNSFYAQIGNSRNTLVLTDTNGLVLEQLCDPLQEREFAGQGLAPGFLWNEQTAGTNGPGTCLHEGRPITVYREDHFFEEFANLSCSAAPIWRRTAACWPCSTRPASTAPTAARASDTPCCW